MTDNEFLEFAEVDPNRKRIRTIVYGGVRYLLASVFTNVKCYKGEATKSRPWFIVSVEKYLKYYLIEGILWFGLRNVNRY